MSDATDLEVSVEETQILLDASQRENLSKALFPETHTDKIRLLDKGRTLTPLPIKTAKRLHKALYAVAELIQKATDELASIALDEGLLDGIINSSMIIADHYGWEDVKDAIEKEEVSMTELQELLQRQQALQAANDFLLTPLRITVATMQLAEIGTVRFLSTFSGPRSFDNISAALMNSSQNTLTPS